MQTFLDQFLQYHYHRILDGRITNVLKHCHVHGMWSIVLHDEKENRIRIFFADVNHKLHLNSKQFIDPMSLAIHPHHCNVVLYPLFGNIHNITFTESQCKYFPDEINLLKLKYNSAILNSNPSIEIVGNKSLYYDKSTHYRMYGPINMYAKELHTIYIPETYAAAWIVFEGKEDDSYENVMYSNNPKFDFNEHYSKNFSQTELIDVFQYIMKRSLTDKK